VHPVDIEAQAAALYQGLFMAEPERRDRHELCVATIRDAAWAQPINATAGPTPLMVAASPGFVEGVR
jgi:trehalose-6-phosphate synthase